MPMEGWSVSLNLWTYQQNLTKLAKLNRDIFTLTLGPRLIPARALILSKKRKRIKYREYRRNLQENGDMSLSMMTFVNFPKSVVFTKGKHRLKELCYEKARIFSAQPQNLAMRRQNSSYKQKLF